MQIRSKSPNGLLFWAGQVNGSIDNDYISLGLQNGAIVYSYDLGSGPVVISYNNSRISRNDGKWHKIIAQR